jgi:predicted deacetylase
MTTAAAAQFLPVVAMAELSPEAVVVSLHDITPSSREICDQIVSRLSRLGVRACSLLVVPDYHRQQPMVNDRTFISWLRDLEAAGHEMVIHGYFHDRPRRAGESLRAKVITRLYTRSEGEFFDLDYDEALRRITSGYQLFGTAGLTARGFIAPAWLLSAEAERAARDAGLEYTTRLRTLVDLRSGDTFGARALVYSVANDWRRAVSLIWNSGVFQLTKDRSLMRLSIHPADYSFPAIWSQIERFISEMIPFKVPTTYRDWIGEQRTARSL